ncbi:hypothetical protein OPV22_018906 [Ensete ventricosum]|uniref:Uncharacterized protein n=1 Tax=Ensete ventricosum TaxID=4639 RepID=A0AAV8QWN3_ENSVE|nr:hypothetical protein OPV22_018906 [Ensete ventricosum]
MILRANTSFFIAPNRGELRHLLRTQVFGLFITQLHCLQFLSFDPSLWYLIWRPHKRNACLKLHDASKAFV